MSMQDILAGLQKTYLASMPEKINRIETLFAAKSMRELESEYHKLKGTGRTYGIPEVTLLGAAMEHLCESHAGSLGDLVPVSIALIKDITESRIKGETFDIEAHDDYKRMVALLEGKDRRTGSTG